MTIYYHLSCRWSQSITRRQKSCRRHHWTIEWKFGKESPFTTTSGKLIEYLKMTLDYTTKGTVENINVWIHWESTQPTAIRHEWKCHNAGCQTPVQCQPRSKQCAQNNCAAFHLLEANYCIYQDVHDKTCKQQLPFYVLGSRDLMKMTIKTH